VSNVSLPSTLACFGNPMICSSVNLDFFLSASLSRKRTLLTLPWH